MTTGRPHAVLVSAALLAVLMLYKLVDALERSRAPSILTFPRTSHTACSFEKPFRTIIFVKQITFTTPSYSSTGPNTVCHTTIVYKFRLLHHSRLIQDMYIQLLSLCCRRTVKSSSEYLLRRAAMKCGLDAREAWRPPRVDLRSIVSCIPYSRLYHHSLHPQKAKNNMPKS